MLEALLFTYQGQFGEAFPLQECSEMREIDLINLLYTCLLKNQPYYEGMRAEKQVFGAPGQK